MAAARFGPSYKNSFAPSLSLLHPLPFDTSLLPPTLHQEGLEYNPVLH